MYGLMPPCFLLTHWIYSKGEEGQNKEKKWEKTDARKKAKRIQHNRTRQHLQLYTDKNKFITSFQNPESLRPATYVSYDTVPLWLMQFNFRGHFATTMTGATVHALAAEYSHRVQSSGGVATA